MRLIKITNIVSTEEEWCGTYKHMQAGALSFSLEEPPKVFLTANDDCIMINGHHRTLQHHLCGDTYILCSTTRDPNYDSVVKTRIEDNKTIPDIIPHLPPLTEKQLQWIRRKTITNT